MSKRKKIPHFYAKLMAILEDERQWGSPNRRRLCDISRQFKLSDADLKIALDELEDMALVKTKKSHNAPTSIFINQQRIL